MSYYISKTIDSNFEKAIERVTETLKSEGFGVITTINLNEKFKEKLDVDFRKYTILGACNPKVAYQALQLEDKLGTMLPCSVIVQELESGKIEVAAVDPVASMQAVPNEQIQNLTGTVRDMLAEAIRKL